MTQSYPCAWVAPVSTTPERAKLVEALPMKTLLPPSGHTHTHNTVRHVAKHVKGRVHGFRKGGGILCYAEVMSAGGAEWAEAWQSLLGASVRTCDAVTDEVPDDAAKAGVEDGLEQDVLDVLGADRSGGEHREARLHEED